MVELKGNLLFLKVAGYCHLKGSTRHESVNKKLTQEGLQTVPLGKVDETGNWI